MKLLFEDPLDVDEEVIDLLEEAATELQGINNGEEEE